MIEVVSRPVARPSMLNMVSAARCEMAN